MECVEQVAILAAKKAGLLLKSRLGQKRQVSYKGPVNLVTEMDLLSERIIVYPDAYGNFSVQLLRYAEVIVEIKRLGINYKFTVPNQATAPLLGLLPPI